MMTIMNDDNDDACLIMTVVARRVWSAKSRREPSGQIHRVWIDGHPRRLAMARCSAATRPLSLLGNCRLDTVGSHFSPLSHVRSI